MSAIDALALRHLQGATQDKPMRLDQLAEKLGGIPPGAMDMVAERLRDARAINLVRITKDGETHDVAWPTGIPPKPLSARDFCISTPRRADEPKALSAAPTPQEPAMPRIAQPAQPRPPHPHPHNKGRKINYPARPSPVVDACLEALRAAGGEVTSDDVFDALPKSLDTTRACVGTTLRKMIQRGLVQHRKAYIRQRTRLVFWVGEAPPTAAFEAGPLGGGDIYAPDEAAVAQAAAEAVAATPDHFAGAGKTQGAHFAIWDDGTVSIDSGAEMIRLTADDAARLYRMLRGQALTEALA